MWGAVTVEIFMHGLGQQIETQIGVQLKVIYYNTKCKYLLRENYFFHI